MFFLEVNPVSYEKLKRLILDCVTMDSLPWDPKIEPYIERIKRGERAGAVIREFMRTIDMKRTWTLKHKGKEYKVHMTSKFKGHATANLDSKAAMQSENLVAVATRVLQCLANLDRLLRTGKPTYLIEDDGHRNSKGEVAHPGYHWVYIEDECEGRVKGRVMVQIAIPPEEKSKQEKFPELNRLYHIIAEGAPHFEARHKQFEEKMATEGDVVVSLHP